MPGAGDPSSYFTYDNSQLKITMSGAKNTDWVAGSNVYTQTGKFTKATQISKKFEFSVNLYRNCNLLDL